MAAKYEYVLEISCTALQCQVRVNDCTIFRTFQPSKRVARLKTAPWCLVGENRFDLELAPIEHDEDKLEPELSMEMYKVTWGDKSHPNAQLLGYYFSDNEVDLPALGEPPRRVFSHKIRINEHYGDWCWLGATPYVEEDRQDVVGTLKHLHKALADRDIGVVLASLAIRRTEICEALRWNADEVELEEYSFFESYFEEEEWAMEPLDDDELLVIPEAGGRLVRVTRPGGVIPLLGRGGVRPFVFDVTFSKIDGHWLVVR